MNHLVRLIIGVYARLLNLYPRGFRDEFAVEMLDIFRDSVMDAARDGPLPLIVLCLRELGGLPFSILREFWYEFGRKETVIITNENLDLASTRSIQSSHREAFWSTLPFAVFGIVCMIGKIRIPWVGIYVYLAFYLFLLLGLLMGLVRAFPRWAYSYLGWSLVFVWWWTDMYTRGFKLFGYTFSDEAWGWRVWVPLFITIGIAILLTRSLRPLRELVLGIWQDWTLLSLAAYSFIGFMMLLYDEVRSPYTIAFMTASILVICASVWIFMRSTNRFHRFGILMAGFFVGLILDSLCAATWDFNAYHGLPAQPPMPWYSSLFGMIFYAIMWSPLVWMPAVVGLFRSTFRKE